MEQKSLLMVGGALVVGGVIGAVLASGCFGDYSSKHRYQNYMMDNREDMSHRGHMMMSLDDSSMADMMHNMNQALEGKQGAEFDEAFLREMIIHHEGAVQMAEAARERAGDERIKALAEAIITAQEKEIADMKSWQKVE